MNPPQIRWLIRRDMPEVLEIERQSFEFAWADDDFLDALRQRNCIGMVAERDDKIVGFMIYDLSKTQLHVLNFAVAPKSRRSRVGTEMLNKLKAKLHQQRRTEIRCEVRESNLAAQRFLRESGFLATNIVRGHYDETSEDAYVFRYRLDAVVPVSANRIANYL